MGRLIACSLKLKPPKIPKSGKKLYKEFFLRDMKEFTHIYWLDGLYLVSVPKPLDAKEWIDKNENLIYERVWCNEDKGKRCMKQSLF